MRLSGERQIELQQAFWNEWNTTVRETSIGKVSIEQAAVVLRWLTSLGQSLDIIEIGCGTGWLCSRLTQFGPVTGTDLSDVVLGRAASRNPDVRFIVGDFMSLDLGAEMFDVAVSLEVLSHVSDQAAFLRRTAELLRPGGHLLIATQNRRALESNNVSQAQPGQLRRWVDRHELRRLLSPIYEVEEIFSITPRFNRGFLRLVNSDRLNRIASTARLGVAMTAMKLWQERAWLGWTLMARARKREL